MGTQLDLDDAAANVSGDLAKRELAKLRNDLEGLKQAATDLYGQALRVSQGRDDPLFKAALRVDHALRQTETLLEQG